jgi:PglZ domain
LAIVINDIDEMLHGSIMGNTQLFHAVEKWVTKGNIIALIQKLKADGYTIYLSADHGNVEARGMGNLTLQEKTGNLSRSKRHIHFSNAILAKNFAKKYSSEKIGQLDNSLYLRHSDAFTLSEQTVVTHGGSHFWEIIVPFIIL